VWNFEAEQNFWLKQVVKVQRFLLSTEKCLPFTWNSVTASVSDGTEFTLTDDEIAGCKNLYEAGKPLYSFGSRQQTTADDIALAPPADYDANNPAHAANPFDTGAANFPTSDVTDYATAPEPMDDLPF
jgi:hypothetical protein